MVGLKLKSSVFLLLAGLLLGSCSPFTSKKPPIILILLESFSEQDYLCADPRKLEDLFHLQEVCDEFVRYTHAFAPTTLTQPNISSILTGLPLSKHHVDHNGAVAISNRIQTLAEEALQMKMRTGFFSGGVPLLKKFGVVQGYEEFNEPFQGREPKLYKPLADSIKDAMIWLDQEVQRSSFFMTFYAPDLLYKNRITQNQIDNERPNSRTSHVLEIHETINDFIGDLKKRKRWDRTHFIVLGLSGPDHSLRPFNPLSSQYLHVPFQIKPSLSAKTNLGELTSEIMSFDKMGRWLKQMIQHQPQEGDLIFSPEPSDLFIPQQNTWAHWQKLSNWSTLGLRRKQYLFSFNPNLQVFDTYFDKKEYEPVPSEEARLLAERYEVGKQMKQFFPYFCEDNSEISHCQQKQLDRKTISQLSMLYRWYEMEFSGEQPVDRFRERLNEAFKEDQQIIIHWLANRALYEKRWVDLFEIGKKSKKPEWMLVAQLNLRETPSQTPSHCLRYFVGEKGDVRDFYQNCQDSGLRRVVEGLHFLKGKKRPSESFWTQVNEIKGRRDAKAINLSMLFINDIASPFDFAPTLSELYFFLPENSDYLELINVDKT